ncbi:hypothetical protein ACFRMQ_36645 [Kitasatospora sp. NPDC056783]
MTRSVRCASLHGAEGPVCGEAVGRVEQTTAIDSVVNPVHQHAASARK